MKRRAPEGGDPIRGLMQALGKADLYDRIVADMEKPGPRDPEYPPQKPPPLTWWKSKKAQIGIGQGFSDRAVFVLAVATLVVIVGLSLAGIR